MKIYYQKFGCYILRKKIKKVLETALSKMPFDFRGFSVNIKMLAEDEIQDLNKTFRNVDSATDVLSFPYLELEKGNNFDTKKLAKEISPEDGLICLGDIAICKTVAKKQAKTYGHSFKREICFLALHGFLHLLGFDHESEKDEKEMQDFAEEILRKNKVNGRV